MFRRRNKSQPKTNADNLREMIQRLRGLEAETLAEIKTSSSTKNKAEARKEVTQIRQRIRVYQKKLSVELRKEQAAQVAATKEKVKRKKVRRQNFETFGKEYVQGINRNLLPIFSGQQTQVLPRTSYWEDFRYGR